MGSFFFFKQKTAYEIMPSLVGSEMCIRDRGYWGHTPQLVLHPQRYGVQPVPWLVADGYIANYQEVLNALPLILVTSNWVKEMYVRDGINGDKIEVLPVGCDTDAFIPYSKDDPKILAVREALGISPDQIMILTVGGDAASKGAQEVMPVSYTHLRAHE